MQRKPRQMTRALGVVAPWLERLSTGGPVRAMSASLLSGSVRWRGFAFLRTLALSGSWTGSAEQAFEKVKQPPYTQKCTLTADRRKVYGQPVQH